MTLTHQNIEQLILLCKSGNHYAQLEIYNRYYKAMYNTAHRILKDKYEAEDIMQDSFLTAFTKLDSLKETINFGAWLKRIVINNSIYHFNRGHKYNEIPLEEVLYKVEGHTEIAKNTDFNSVKAKQVLATLKTLKNNYRIALTLHLIEGYDYEEISDIMNISYANCRTTISRAKEKLRQTLQPIAEY
ncbi:MAG: RNA polymerase sigma factor [Flavobacteriaceae bacterium]|nr:RNA polymerase sigma factor [Flavobacteriaceae bacterium]